ncbi:MAG: hypothetical protein CL908_13545 [Deltaproteobacteria bacterium]|nr:hypothetical protein [Deltaproteobacteria bacterium]
MCARGEHRVLAGLEEADTATAGISRVSRRLPSGFSAYSPLMRIPRSGFQQTITTTGSPCRCSTAARPVTQSPRAIGQRVFGLSPFSVDRRGSQEWAQKRPARSWQGI